MSESFQRRGQSSFFWQWGLWEAGWRPGWRVMEGGGWAHWRVKEDITGTEVGRWIALTQQPNEACVECMRWGSCVFTDSRVLQLRCDLKGVGAQNSHSACLPTSPFIAASILFLIHSFILFLIFLFPMYRCFFIHCFVPSFFFSPSTPTLFFLHSSLPHLPYSLLQPVPSNDLLARLSDAEESALGPQEELDKETHAQRETSLKLTQVSLQHLML